MDPESATSADDSHGPETPDGPPPVRSFWLTRAEDQLDVRLFTYDLTLTLKPDGTAELIVPAAGGYLMLQFLGQHTMESIPTSLTELKTGQFPVYGAPSGLSFRVPGGHPPIPFTIEGILAILPTLALWVDPKVATVPALPAASQLAEARVVADGDQPSEAAVERLRRAAARSAFANADDENENDNAAALAEPVDDSQGSPGQLTAPYTSLKFPHRLNLSMRGGASRFSHPVAPAGEDGRYALWHTRLTRLRADGRLADVPMEIVVLSSNEGGAIADPTHPWVKRTGDARLAPLGGLDKATRTDLVKLSSQALNGELLMLSNPGAWLDVDREFTATAGTSLVSYRHKLVNGRDITIRVAKAGTLFPLGHRAQLVTVTERVFEAENRNVAGLVITKQAVIVTEKTRPYKQVHRAVRGWPWTEVSVVGRTSPSGIAKPYKGTTSTELLTEDGNPITFTYIGLDRGGRTATFELPVIFVPNGQPLPLATYNHPTNAPNRTVALGGQVVTVATPLPDAPEAPDVVADQVVIEAVADPTQPTRSIATVKEITGQLPALQNLAALPTGGAQLASAISGGGSHVVKYTDKYLDFEFDPGQNPIQSLFQLVSTAPVVGLADPSVTGGLVAPSFSLETVSRLIGPVAGKFEAALKGKVKAAELLSGVLKNVTLFGVFPLDQLIGDLDLDILKDAPKLITNAIDGAAKPRMTWKLPLFQGSDRSAVKAKQVEVGMFSGELRPRAGQKAQLVIELRTEGKASEQLHVVAECSVEQLELGLGLSSQELVTLPVKKIFFRSVDGRKPEIDLQLDKPKFGGVLALLKTLAGQIPDDGFADPPALDVRSDGIRSSYSVPIPDIGAGMFALSNIRFGAELNIWYEKAPEIGFDFATQENRFRIAVLGLAGGGYLGIGLSTRGLERLAGMLEFGAAASVNLGIAKGSVSLMAGVHVVYERGGDAWIEGYVDLRGEIEVLKIVEIGVKLYIALTYNFNTGELSGRAELQVKIRVLFFRKTVRVPFEYTIIGGSAGNDAARRGQLAAAGQPGLPGFVDQMAPASWPATTPRPLDTYCLAFA